MKITDTLSIVNQKVSDKTKVDVQPPPTSHVLILDCSGSMYSDLPRIREQLKKKLPTLVLEGDLLSIIWFSGRGECGTLLEAEPVSTLKDLAQVNAAIDRWLKPIGLTGFLQPIQEAGALIDRVAKKHPNYSTSLSFFSDGADNCSSRTEILREVQKLAPKVAAATFIEYSWYADRNFLSAMAENAGGTLIHASTFDSFQPILDRAISSKPLSAKKVEIKIPDAPIDGFLFTLEGKDIVTYVVEDGKASVPETTQEVYYLAQNDHDDDPSKEEELRATSALYGAMTLFAQRMKSDIVFPILRKLGDVRFIESYASCFGKQRYSDFVDQAKEATFDPSKRLVNGYDPNKVPADDAYTILDLLQKLASLSANALLDHPDFKYAPIGRGRIDSNNVLTAEETAEVAALTAEMAKTKNAKKVKEISDRIAAITSAKKEALKFVEVGAEEGNPISNLTYNEERPNVSMLVTKQGVVDLSDRLPEEFKGTSVGKIPTQFPTFVFRNYTLVKDGLVNVDMLPVRVDDLSHFPPESYEKREQNIVVFKLRDLPAINRQMVKSVEAKSFFQLNWDLLKVKAAQKVYNSFQKELFPGKPGDTFAALYGEEGAAWLKEQGITERGFSPKSVLAESTDFYLAKKLKVGFKGYSTLPALKEARTKIAAGKENGPISLMKPTIEEVLAKMPNKDPEKDTAFETWLRGKQEETVKQARALMLQLAKVNYSIIVGQVWPFPSLDENSLTLTDGSTSVVGTMSMEDVEERI